MRDPRRRRDLLVLDAVVARGHAIQNLSHDLHRLADLVETDCEAIETVAIRTDDDIEFQFVVVHVRHVTTKVPWHAGTAQNRAGGTECHRFLGCDHADTLQPVTPDGLAGHQDVVFL